MSSINNVEVEVVVKSITSLEMSFLLLLLQQKYIRMNVISQSVPRI